MMLRGRVHLSTICLVTIGLFDLVTSLIWLNSGYAEGNRIFAWLASQGTLAFALGKVLFLAGPILVLEYARKSHPKSAEQGTWLAFLFYAFFYVSHLVRLFG